MVRYLSDTAGQLANRPGFLDFQREAAEFEARKRQRQMQEQMMPLQMEKQRLELAQMEKELATGASSNDPAAVREYNFFSKLSPQEQEKYLNMKRSQQVLNLGGQMAVRSPLGGIGESYTVTPKISEMPEFQGMQAGAAEQAKLQQQLQYDPIIKQAVESGKSQAARSSELKELEATLPQLMATVEQLSDLGQKATYTMAGQGLDIARRELGLKPREAAVARREYISLVDNQILPLLRQIFGSQFTEREGESLKRTLGDVNASPEEKDAVLRSFINQKVEQIQTLRRQMDQPPMESVDPMLASERAREAQKRRISLEEFLQE